MINCITDMPAQNLLRRLLALPALCAFLLFTSPPARAAEVIVVGDTQLAPVVDIIAGIRDTLHMPVAVYAPADVKGRLARVVAKEGARTVVALGKDAIDEALHLPEHVAVVYDMVITPVRSSRPNTTGTYMATPVGEYTAAIQRHLPSLRRIAVVSSQALLSALGSAEPGQVISLRVRSSYEMVDAIQQLGDADAVLLLPDVSLLTTAALEEIYLHSFRRNIPLLGVSEKNVKQGALFALVFDPPSVGRQLGERVAASLSGGDIGQVPAAPSRKFNLYLNTDTAKKMGIRIPDEMLREARRVYP